MILEMGIVAPFLWILWTAVLLYYAWKEVKQLRGTRFFPIAFAIFFYAFLLLYPFTYGGLVPLIIRTMSITPILWLLVGILFRLPGLPDGGFRA